MQQILNPERDYANKLLEAIREENGESFKRLKDKAKYEKISLLAVLIQWGNPLAWFDEELKLCPFCGNTNPYIDSFDNGIIRMYFTKCPGCLTTSGRFPTEPLALKNWNKRNG